MEYSTLRLCCPFQNLINMDNSQLSSSDFSPLLIHSNELFDLPEIPSYPIEILFSGDDLIQVTSQVEEFEPNMMIEDLYQNFMEGSEESFPSEQVSSQQFSAEGNDVWSPSSLMSFEASSMDSTSIQTSVHLPRDEVEIDNESIIRHLLRAYAESMENGQKELEEVILRCMSEKVSPIGNNLERLAFNFCHQIVDDRQWSHYLKQESLNNFETALKLFYQNFPYGRVAHYAANSAILEAIPEDAEMLHIVDFDLGEGLQLSQMIEALAQRFKTLKVTTIKWEEKETDCGSPRYRFEETKKQLKNHAKLFGLDLKVEETTMENLVGAIKKTKKRDGGRAFLAFNCMFSLPHMRTRRSRSLVIEFLRLAKDLLANSGNSSTRKHGIVTFGEGDACEKLGNDLSFSSLFDANLMHYQALLESMESSFPSHLAEARMVMENIFLAPYVSSQVWFEKWRGMKEYSHVQPWFGLEGRRLSKENLMEAKEIVGDERSYGIRIEGQNGNDMVLEWNGTPLVRVSTWES